MGPPTKAHSLCILPVKISLWSAKQFSSYHKDLNCCSGLKVIFTPPKFQFLGVYPKVWGHIVQTPKRHFLASFHVFWAIARKNPSTGLTCMLIKKGINKIIFCYISPICPARSPQRIDLYQIWYMRSPRGVINCGEFLVDRFSELILRGVKICLFP